MNALLYILYHTNLIGAAFIKETENAIEFLDSGEKGIQSEAELIAKKLKGKLPVIYCDSRLHAMALRFQQQLNENAKQMAHINTFPEMNHNELAGWHFPENLMPLLQPIYFIRTTIMSVLKKAWRSAGKFLKRNQIRLLISSGKGASLLEQYYYLIHLTDWISFYLAKENGVDPDPTETIAHVKAGVGKDQSRLFCLFNALRFLKRLILVLLTNYFIYEHIPKRFY